MLFKLTDHFRIRNVLNFINEYKFDFGSSTTVGTASSLPSNLYIGLGKNGGFDSNLASSIITDTVSDIDSFRLNVKSLIKVDDSDMDLAVKRYDWDDFKNGNVIFNKRDTALTHSYYTAVVATTQYYPFYCINSNHNIPNNLTKSQSFQVFELVTLNQHGTSSVVLPESDRPRVLNGSAFGTQFTDSVGNVWEYMFQLTSYQMDAIKNTTVIPVSYIYDYVNTQSITLAEQVMRRLGTMFIIITCRINTTMVPISELFSLEQTGLIANPLDSSGNRLNLKHYDVQGVDSATVDINSGDVLYIENRVSMFRQTEQEEEIQIVLEY